ncbi:MAG: anti-sigma factor, partial [Actinomycetota bacterium]|nr:anti-sigma factor [Actinomycetota bacterium]
VVVSRPARTPTIGRVLTWAAPVAVAVAAALVAFVLLSGDGGVVEFDGEMVSADGGESAQVTVEALGIGRRISLDTDDLPILPTSEYYELWFVGPGDTPQSPNRISAGTFHPDEDGRSQIEFVAAVDPTLYPTMVITAEPGDGNPLPGGPEVLRAVIPERS